MKNGEDQNDLRHTPQGSRFEGNRHYHTSPTVGAPSVGTAPAEPDPVIAGAPKAERDAAVGKTILRKPGEGLGVEILAGSEVIDRQREGVAAKTQVVIASGSQVIRRQVHTVLVRPDRVLDEMECRLLAGFRASILHDVNFLVHVAFAAFESLLDRVAVGEVA